MRLPQKAASAISRFLKADRAQDVAEYCLLTALVALIALGIFWRISGGIKGVWGNADTTLTSGRTAASAGTPASSGSTASGSSTSTGPAAPAQNDGRR